MENNEEQNIDGLFNNAVDVHLDCDICYDEVNTVIKGLKLNKALGADGVISEIFVHCFDLINLFYRSCLIHFIRDEYVPISGAQTLLHQYSGES